MNVLDKMSPRLRELHMAVEFREAAVKCFEHSQKTGEPKILDCARKVFDAQIAVDGNLTRLGSIDKSDNDILWDGDRHYHTRCAVAHAGYDLFHIFQYPGAWCRPSWAKTILGGPTFDPTRLSPKTLTFHRAVIYRDLTVLRVRTDDLWDELVAAECASIAQMDVDTYAYNLKPTTDEMKYLQRYDYHEAVATLAELNRRGIVKGYKYKKTDWSRGYYGVNWGSE